MIQSVVYAQPPAIRDVSELDRGCIWGLELLDAHDRYWASRRVQVIRRGMGTQPNRAASLFMLLEQDDVIMTELTSIARVMRWDKPRLLRVRLVEHDRDQYVERVDADEMGRLVAIRRVYSPRARRATRIQFTIDPILAGHWASTQSGIWAAHRELRAIAHRDRTSTRSAAGTVRSVCNASDRVEAWRSVLTGWTQVSSVLDGVYEYQPGVWIHESAQIAEGARFVQPVWIGAGVSIGAEEVVVGPWIEPDTPESFVVPSPVAYDTLGLPGWSIRIERRTLLSRAIKRLFDIAFSACVLLMTLPIYPLIMLAIALEDGWPFFFAHQRQTISGRVFPCIKFRTMCKNAEALRARIQSENACDGPQFYMKRDPRLLRIGGPLRKYKIDELPQFINVLLGHMSVVGPRPSPDAENQWCPAWREARLSVRPGITGLWQVRRTREPATDFQEWVRYDLEYVQHQSLRLDMWIIIQTIRCIFKE